MPLRAGEFSFGAEAYARGQMEASLAINLVATLSGAGALFRIPGIIRLGTPRRNRTRTGADARRVATAKADDLASLSQIKLEPEHIDPIAILQELVSSRSADKKE